MTKRIASIAAAVLAVVSLGATSAKADTFSITVSQRSGLADGQSVSIKTVNLPADTGIYVFECVLVDGKVSKNVADCTSTENDGSALWIGTTEGASDPMEDASFTILRTINGKDCLTTTCAIVTKRDNADSTDRSLDSITPITLSSLAVEIDKTEDLVDAGDELSVSITGIPANQGVYVRECEVPADGGRPVKCDNPNAVWASNDETALTQGGVDAGAPFTVKVKGLFALPTGSVDCQVTQCGLFIERDSKGLSDRSLDASTPINFAEAVKVKQVVTGWKKAPGAVKLKLKKSITLASASLKSSQGNTLTWKTNNKKSCTIVVAKDSVNIKAGKAGKCVITATAPESVRTSAASFTWKVTVAKK
jgi:hypothetical protein